MSLDVLMAHVFPMNIFVMALLIVQSELIIFAWKLLALIIWFWFFSGSDEGWCDPSHDPNAADICDMSACELPDCHCSKDGTLIPGHLEPSQVPQMIILTFDSLNFENWDLYTQTIFTPNRKNPNGCPIRVNYIEFNLVFELFYKYKSYFRAHSSFPTNIQIINKFKRCGMMDMKLL